MESELHPRSDGNPRRILSGRLSALGRLSFSLVLPAGAPGWDQESLRDCSPPPTAVMGGAGGFCCGTLSRPLSLPVPHSPG